MHKGELGFVSFVMKEGSWTRGCECQHSLFSCGQKIKIKAVVSTVKEAVVWRVAGIGERHFQETSLTMDSPGRKRHQKWFCPLFWAVPLAFRPRKVSFPQQAGLAKEEKNKEMGSRGFVCPHP